MSTLPLLGPDAERSYGSASSPSLYGKIRTRWRSFFWDAFGPSWVVYDAVHLMANGQDVEQRDELTRNWRDHKIEELRFVGTVGALLAGCLASTGSWPNILPHDRDKPWGVRACWYSGLVFALFAVVISCQQSMRLHRLSAHRDGLKYIRASLTGQKGPDGLRPLVLQLYAWEASLVCLTGSIICAITGLTGLVWVGYVDAEDGQPGKDGSTKLAVTFTATLGLSLLIFLSSQTGPARDSRE
ncbi:hypothetical protein B0T10DRAFT_483958 [Thelonectria olida]|uniref:Uncharacterized protein n=1 Tax=Thelonectria olida TaxID=1576542 RepID=A0A9P8W8M9_9HYPO|nr:hypothetical protein B0T10DRAFT_483958 [Thelonectria olida]